MDSAHTAPAVYEKLRAEGRLYEQKFKRISTKGIEWQGKLTQQVTSICQQNNVMLMELPTPVQEVQNGYGIQTSIIKLAGTYLNLVQSVYDLEETPAVGRVASLNFVTETDRKTKKMTLHAYIYLQNIERGGSNEF